ncbi:MAG TPA: hypothetical protein VK095_10955 [Beutenbergiaceae bacterium]|nr:hypothetical protein [Beutenbergiaceae bacterium]
MAEVSNDDGQTSRPEGGPPSRLRNIGALLGVVVGVVAFQVLPAELATMILFGALAGTVAGLLPYFIGRNRSRPLAIGSIWLSAAIGAYGGIVYAGPAAIVMALVLRFAIRPAAGAKLGDPGAPAHPTAPGSEHYPSQAPQPGSWGQPGQASQPPQPGQWDAR